MSTTTGWPPGLLQDDCKKLSQWYASRIDARHVVRQVCREIRQKRMEKEMSDKQPDALRLADFLSYSMTCGPTERQAAAELRTQHAAIERKDALLRQAEQMMRWAADIMVLSPQDAPGFFDDLNAITKELQ